MDYNRIIEIEDGLEVIVDIDDNEISYQFERIYTKTKTCINRYIGSRKDDSREAIFTIDSIKPLTIWHDEIYMEGYINDNSDYFIARDNGTEAIYELTKNAEIQRSLLYREIKKDGFIKNQSSFIITQVNDCYKLLEYNYRTNEFNVVLDEVFIQLSSLGLLQGKKYKDKYYIIGYKKDKDVLYFYNKQTKMFIKSSHWGEMMEYFINKSLYHTK